MDGDGVGDVWIDVGAGEERGDDGTVEAAVEVVFVAVGAAEGFVEGGGLVVVEFVDFDGGLSEEKEGVLEFAHVAGFVEGGFAVVADDVDVGVLANQDVVDSDVVSFCWTVQSGAAEKVFCVGICFALP